ncbi:WXG100-like domain-containing protein [Nocardia nova]
MTLTLPPWLPEPVMTCVAGHFPTGDESAMRRCADAWADTADQCRPMAERHTAAAHTIRAAGLGHTVDQFAQQHTELADTWRDQATYCDSMAKQLYEGANSIEFQKLVCIFTAGVLAAQLIRDGIAFAAGGGLLAIADRMAAETALGILRKKVLMWLAGAGVKAAAERGLLVLARNAVIIGMAQGGLVNLAAQGVQIMQGHRDDIDPASAAVAIIAGGAGGAAGAVVGHAVAPVPAMFGRTAARTFDRLAPHLGSNITAGLRQAAATRAARLFAHLGGTVFVGGAGGVAGGMAGAVVSLAATGQAFTRQAFAEGIIPGFAGGFLGAAGAALRHAPGSMPAGVPGTPRPESGAPARVRWVDRGTRENVAAVNRRDPAPLVLAASSRTPARAEEPVVPGAGDHRPSGPAQHPQNSPSIPGRQRVAAAVAEELPTAGARLPERDSGAESGSARRPDPFDHNTALPSDKEHLRRQPVGAVAADPAVPTHPGGPEPAPTKADLITEGARSDRLSRDDQLDASGPRDAVSRAAELSSPVSSSTVRAPSPPAHEPVPAGVVAGAEPNAFVTGAAEPQPPTVSTATQTHQPTDGAVAPGPQGHGSTPAGPETAPGTAMHSEAAGNGPGDHDPQTATPKAQPGRSAGPDRGLASDPRPPAATGARAEAREPAGTGGAPPKASTVDTADHPPSGGVRPAESPDPAPGRETHRAAADPGERSPASGGAGGTNPPDGPPAASWSGGDDPRRVDLAGITAGDHDHGTQAAATVSELLRGWPDTGPHRAAEITETVTRAIESGEGTIDLSAEMVVADPATGDRSLRLSVTETAGAERHALTVWYFDEKPPALAHNAEGKPVIPFPDRAALGTEEPRFPYMRRVGEERGHLEAQLNRAGWPEDHIDAAKLIHTEVYQNAVGLNPSGRPPVSYRSEIGPGPGGPRLRVSVTDHIPGLPPEYDPANPTAVDKESSRGGLLRAELSHNTGIDEHPDGSKSIWFELDRSEPVPEREPDLSQFGDLSDLGDLSELGLELDPTGEMASDRIDAHEASAPGEFTVPRALGEDAAATAAWDWLGEQMPGWPPGRVDDAGLTLADAVAHAVDSTDGPVRVTAEQTGTGADRVLHISVLDTGTVPHPESVLGDAVHGRLDSRLRPDDKSGWTRELSFSIHETPPLPQWLHDAIAPVRHLVVNDGNGTALAVGPKQFLQMAKALAPHVDPAHLDVAAENIHAELKHAGRVNYSRLNNGKSDFEPAIVQLRAGEPPIEIEVYPFWANDLRNSMRELGLTGRGDATVRLDDLADAMSEQRALHRAAREQAAAADRADRLVRTIREQAGLPPEQEHGDVREKRGREFRQMDDMNHRRLGPDYPSFAGEGAPAARGPVRNEPTADLAALLNDVGNAPGGSRLVVGGGHLYRPAEAGEVFVNAGPHAHPDLLADVRDLSALPSGIFDEIYYERVPAQYLPDAVPELYRVLKPGGKLLVSTGIAGISSGDSRAAALYRLRDWGFEDIRYTIARDDLHDAEARPNDWYEITATKSLQPPPDRPVLRLRR